MKQFIQAYQALTPKGQVLFSSTMVINCEEEINISQTVGQIKEQLANELGLKSSHQIILGDRREQKE